METLDTKNHTKTTIVTDRIDRSSTLDEIVIDLSQNKKRWAQTTIEERIRLLDEVRSCVMEVAREWAEVASNEEEIPAGSPLRGEEWLAGPYTVISTCNNFISTLSQMGGNAFLERLPVRQVRDDQIAVRVVPNSVWDRLLLSGVTADIWMEKGVDADNLRENTASAYDSPASDREGSVSLVLGAGNISAIGPLDCFQKLFVDHAVVILKLNPVNDYLRHILGRALKPLIDFGALAIVSGGAETGEYLCNHPEIESIHITGAGATHDAIVWGTGEAAVTNRQMGKPRNSRRVTSELGAVCPTIVVPGPWTSADIRFQAEQVATQKMHNSGFNCVACQMLVLPREWDQRDQFLDQLKTTIAKLPERGLYYPGASDRMAEYARNCPGAENAIDLDDNSRCAVFENQRDDAPSYAEQNEVFAPVLSVSNIGGADAETFLRAAIQYCNENLHGTLGANIVIHPKTKRLMQERWDEIIGDLRYGCIAINAWTGLGFLSPQTPWGAFPGHTLADVQSGIGFVHNTFMFDKPERTVIEAPFRPFPRNLLHGSFALLPRPPWFVTNKKADVLGKQLTRFQHKPSLLKIPGIFANALLG